ncbi:MAG TPA: hypothetical protein VJ985_04905 [Gammaproteobacteria bacterium]|nr:hypothetical protein [Gammaproteobacteria bacterium]
MRLSWYLDVYQLEHRVVRARNALNFRLQPKDRRDRAKVFVVGHPRTGTKSVHKILSHNGWNCLHTSGNWNTRKYDCFSDRGNFQPFRAMEQYYRNSFFILNTRPVYKYIRSVINHRFGRGKRSSGLIPPTVRNIEHEIMERNQDFLRFARHFRGKDNFLVMNIERPGAFDFLAAHLGLEWSESQRERKKEWREQDLDKIEQAFTGLGLAADKEAPFLLDRLLSPADQELHQAFLREHADRIRL